MLDQCLIGKVPKEQVSFWELDLSHGLARSKTQLQLLPQRLNILLLVVVHTNLWIQQQLRDYGLNEEKTLIFCYNTSAIAITQNPKFHARTKNIDVRHHFIRDHVEKGNIEILKIGTEDQLADIFTKPLQESRFLTLRHSLGLIEMPKD